MLVEHNAPYLLREDAYKDYCWAVDAFGLYQPASFIYSCYQSLSELFIEQNIILVEPSALEDDNVLNVAKVYGLILRIKNNEDVKQINNALLKGNNVIGLIPNECVATWYKGNKEMIESVKNSM